MRYFIYMRRFVLLFLVIIFATVCYGKAPKAKFGYMFFNTNSTLLENDSLVKVCVSIDDNCWYSRDLDRHLENNPKVIVKIENATTKLLFFDLAQCFIIRNKKAEMFWDNTQNIRTSGSNKGGTMHIGSITNALGVGGVVGTLANGLTIGGETNSSISTITQNERVLRIPPLSEEIIRIPIYSKSLDHFGYKVTTNLSWEGSSFYYLNPGILKGECLNFTLNNTPLQLSIFLTYSKTEGFEEEKNMSFNLYVDKLVGTKEWIGSKESTNEIKQLGYNISNPYFMVKFEKD